VYHANVIDVNIDKATAIFIYLVPEGMRAMQPVLVAAIARGARVVSYGNSHYKYFISTTFYYLT